MRLVLSVEHEWSKYYIEEQFLYMCNLFLAHLFQNTYKSCLHSVGVGFAYVQEVFYLIAAVLLHLRLKVVGFPDCKR